MRAALILGAVLAAGGPSLARADQFTPAQRAEIVQTLRDALAHDPSILRDALVALRTDEARAQEQATTAALQSESKRIYDAGDPVEGNPLGDVTLVEFYDTRCPYCRRMLPVIAELLKEEPNLRVTMKDMPILGPASQLESRALLAAQRQGGYFKLRDAIMAGPPSTRDSLRETAARVGLDAGRIMRDMDDPAIKARLDGNVQLGQQIGIGGTPAMVVGRTLLSGATDVAELRAAIADARRWSR